MSRAVGLVLGCALFILYAFHVQGGAGWEDSAFFQLCHAVLGVPHGPGFPLYVLVGRVFVWPFGSASALGSTLFSALAMACAGVVLFGIMLLLGTRVGPEPEGGQRHWPTLCAAAVVLGWATLTINLQQAARAEVYGLSLLLVLLTCFAALCSRGAERTSRSWQFTCAAAWLWGLGMAVHPLIVLAGATPWLVYAAWPWKSRARALVLALLALVPLTLYLFPLLRGRVPDSWAWGDFSSLSSAIDYYTRRSAWSAVVTRDGGWLENLAGWGFGLPALWPMGLWIPSLWALWLLRKKAALFVSLLLLGTLVLWAAPYDPANLDLLGYALPAVCLLAAGVGVAAQRAVGFLGTHMPGLSAGSRLAVGIFFVSLAVGWPAAALLSAEIAAPAHVAGQVARSLCASLPAGATLLVSEDNLLGPLEYEMHTQEFRNDLRIIAVGALRHAHYRHALASRLPSEWVVGWEQGGTWDPVTWEREVRKLLARHHQGDPWFAQYDHLPGLSQKQAGPHGFVQALSGDSSESAWEAGLHFWKDQVKERHQPGPGDDVLGRWVFNFGVLALEGGHTAIGWEAMMLSLSQSPRDPEIYFLLGQALGRAGRSTEAKAMISAALELAPYRTRYREAFLGLSPELVNLP